MIWCGTHLRPSSQGPGHAEGAAGDTFISIATQKLQLRRGARIARRSLSRYARQKKSRRAAHALLHSPVFRRVQTVAAYLHTGSEIETTHLIKCLIGRGKQVVVPLIDRSTEGLMRFVRLDLGTVVIARHLGIRVPVRPLRTSARIDLVILPLTAFDACGHRLGNGGGYYDRWLARQRRRPLCIGYAFAVQGVVEVPVEPWDQCLDAVCTERGMQYFRRP